MFKKIFRIAGLITAVFVLSGCFKLNANVSFYSDDTVSGEIIFAVSESMMGAAADLGGGETDAMFSDEEDLPDGFNVKAYSDSDGFVGSVLSFDRIPIDEVNALSDGEMLPFDRVEKVDDTYVVEVAFDESAAGLQVDGFEDDSDFSEMNDFLSSTMLDSLEFEMVFEFPGRVLEVSDELGVEIDGNKVVLTKDVIGQTENLVITGSAIDEDDSSDMPVLAVAIAVIGGLAILIGGRYIVKNMGDKNTNEAPPAPPAPQNPPTF